MKKIVRQTFKWLATNNAMALPRKAAGSLINQAVTSQNGTIIYYQDPIRSKIFQLIRQIKDEVNMVLGDSEAYQIYMSVRNTAKVDGDIAEVGCFQGGSSKIICEAKQNKAFHIFDTFEGLPELSSIDNPDQFQPGQYAASIESVKKYLEKYNNVFYYKGFFPQTADPVKNKKFSFVHFDVDLYETTLECINFFYPRLNKGGIMISHDYINAPGVRKAFDNFFADKPEPIIEMSGTQCLIVKM